MNKLINSRIFKVAAAVFVTGALLIIFYRILSNYEDFRTSISDFNRIISPFVYGGVLAYLLCPVYNLVVKWTYRQLSKKIKNKKRCLMISRVIASAVALLVLFGVVAGMLALVIPQLIESIVGIVDTLPARLDQVSALFDKFTANMSNKVIANQINKYSQQLQESTIKWAQETLLPGIGTMMQRVSASVILTVKTFLNIMIGIIITVYLLNGKEIFKAQTKKIIYSIMSKERANKIFEFGKYTNRTFGAFINGKIIDSIIIGVICFIAMSVLKLQYPILISTIVGVTNIIPFFGPFIGAIPSAAILFLVSPLQALYFIIMVIILQQFDGNIIGPAILGNSTGLASFWVMFAIVIGGGIFGFMGMVLSVPVFAVIYYYIGLAVGEKLKRKGLEPHTNEYIDFDSYNIEKDELTK